MFPRLLLATGLFCAWMLNVHGQAAEFGGLFGPLKLVDEIRCGGTASGPAFDESPKQASRVETILGQPCRVLPNTGEARFFAYKIGVNKGLKPGRAYVLAVDFPEDTSRSMFILNRGAEMVRGVRTGQAFGDVMFSYTNNNSESLRIPLSGKYETWKSLFFLHDRFFERDLGSEKAGDEKVKRVGQPQDGFWVIIAQSKEDNDPISAGAAVSRIRLFEVMNPGALVMRLNLPPAGLPQRHIFWREEMADGVIMGEDPKDRGVAKQTDWYEYKGRLMQFLGINTFSKDLLEFGHNQGWDCGPNDDWFNRSKFSGLWGDTLTAMKKYGVSVLPYYEYCGGVGRKGLGKEKRAIPLSGGNAYTHISWTEPRNVDITDPDTLEDANRLLDATILKYKSDVKFVGAWFRPRPSQFPISFADATLERFAADANGGKAVTRDELKADDALRQKYYAWWFGKRRDFLVALRDHLRQGGIPGAVVLLTPDASEPGRSLKGHSLVTDDPDAFVEVLKRPSYKGIVLRNLSEVLAADQQLEALTSPRSTWDKWEWQHSDPEADPQDYKDVEGVLLTYSMGNRAYMTSSAKAFDAFRSKAGLAVVQHYPLNEHGMEKSLGYVASDVDYAGPYSMLGEARAMANGDPQYLGYLAASSFNRGFPEYTRDFNANFLALPALPSQILEGASSDAEVVVRSIPANRAGTYLAVVNTGLAEKNVTITLPANGTVADAVTGQPLKAEGGKLQMAMRPCQLKSLVIR